MNVVASAATLTADVIPQRGANQGVGKLRRQSQTCNLSIFHNLTLLCCLHPKPLFTKQLCLLLLVTLWFKSASNSLQHAASLFPQPYNFPGPLHSNNSCRSSIFVSNVSKVWNSLYKIPHAFISIYWNPQRCGTFSKNHHLVSDLSNSAPLKCLGIFNHISRSKEVNRIGKVEVNPN